MQHTLQYLQEQITNNRLDTALRRLRDLFALAESDLLNDAIMLSGQHKKLRSDVRKGIIDYKQETLRHNQLTNAVLSLLDEIRQAPEEFTAYEQAQEQLATAAREKGQTDLPDWMRDNLLARIAFAKERGTTANVLWIDDEPSGHRYESELLTTLGLHITEARSSEEADLLLEAHHYHFILSDIRRGDDATAGLHFHRSLVDRGRRIPFIYYVFYAEPELGVPPYTFGITHHPADLVHLVLDVLGRMQ